MDEGRLEHGDADVAELRKIGLDPRAILDFAVNVNPLGPDPFVVDAVRRAPLDRYPDSRSLLAREALASELGTTPDRVVLGNGAAELLWTLVQALRRPDRRPLRVAIAEPTFSELRRAAEQAGAELTRVWPSRSLEIDLDALAAGAPDADLVYLCNPNNPTGRALPHEAVAKLARALPRAVVVVDQAFLSLSERHADAALPLPDNAIALRSLTKDHALPGLRVAYALAERSLASRLEAARAPWMVSAPAQEAVLAGCRSGHVARTRPILLDHRRALSAMLARLGLGVVASDTIFVLAEVGDAARLRDRLLREHAIAVRDCASFGLPRHVRLCARPPADLARLEAALVAVRGAGGAP